MNELQVELVLPAPPERVWEVLSEFDRYSTWNPYLSMEGKSALNARVRIQSSAREGRPPKTTYMKVSRFARPNVLELRNGVPLLTESVRFFHLFPVEGRTLLKHGVRFTGAMSERWLSSADKVRALRNYYDVFGKVLTDRLMGRRMRDPAGNRHTRRARQARESHKSARPQ